VSSDWLKIGAPEKALNRGSAGRMKNAEKTLKPGELSRPRLGRALAFFVGTCLSGLLSTDRMGILGRWKENGAVVAQFALAASDQMEKEPSALLIQPSQWVLAGTVNFVGAAVRAGFPSDLQCAERNHSWVRV
jgi:hypothetical protein